MWFLAASLVASASTAQRAPTGRLIAVTSTSESVVLLHEGTFVPLPTTLETGPGGALRMLVLRGTRGCRVAARVRPTVGAFEIDWERACTRSSFDARALMNRVVPRRTADGRRLELDGRPTDPDDPRLEMPGPGHHVIVARDSDGTVVSRTEFDVDEHGRVSGSATSMRIPSPFDP